MAKKHFEDRELDGLLKEALDCQAQPPEGLNARLKRCLRQQEPRHTPSLWWLPALCGTAVSGCLVYALSFVADWRCMMAAMSVAALFSLSAWLLSIIGICKFESFKEASKLI